MTSAYNLINSLEEAVLAGDLARAERHNDELLKEHAGLARTFYVCLADLYQDRGEKSEAQRLMEKARGA